MNFLQESPWGQNTNERFWLTSTCLCCLEKGLTTKHPIPKTLNLDRSSLRLIVSRPTAVPVSFLFTFTSSKVPLTVQETMKKYLLENHHFKNIPFLKHWVLTRVVKRSDQFPITDLLHQVSYDVGIVNYTNKQFIIWL